MTITDPTAWPMPTSLPKELGKAAAVYAAAGIPVFPCAPGQKRPLTAHGFHDATTDPTQIDAWWGRYPEANIGIPTGVMVEVLDVDVHATGTSTSSTSTMTPVGIPIFASGYLPHQASICVGSVVASWNPCAVSGRF